MRRAPCCEKSGLKKGPWTSEEDQKLLEYIQKNGYGNWRTLPKNAGLQRCGKSCRLRWTNYLRPDIKRGRFSFEEEETIIQLHSILGNKWSAIAARLPGRTDNEIKNYWNTHIRKRLLRMGIDPVTHSPRLDLLDLSTILASSLYNASQMNLSRLIGVHPLANPELLRLASSLVPSHRENPIFFQQNIGENQFSPLDQVQPNQVQIPFQEMTFPGETQFVEPNVEQFSSEHYSHFNSQNCQVNEWESNGVASKFLGEDYGNLPNYGYLGSDQSIIDIDPPSGNSDFQSNNSNSNSFSFASVLSTLSTPSSSPTPLNSNSTYFSCSSSAATTEDERESYIGNSLLKFELQQMLDVSEFM